MKRTVLILSRRPGLQPDRGLRREPDGQVPKAKLPVLTTSAGQSNDINALNIVMEEADLKYDYCDVPTADMVKAGVGLAGKAVGGRLPCRDQHGHGQVPQGHALQDRSSSPSGPASRAWAPPA